MKTRQDQDSPHVNSQEWPTRDAKKLKMRIGVAPAIFKGFFNSHHRKKRYDIEDYGAGTQAAFWIQMAVSLKHAADVILREKKRSQDKEFTLSLSDSSRSYASVIGVEEMLHKSYLLLAGLALENLMKGICVLTDPSLIDIECGEISKKILGHDLNKLASLVGLEEEYEGINLADFLSHLSQFVVWAGKYPAARKFRGQATMALDPVVESDYIEVLFENLMTSFVKVANDNGGVVRAVPRVNWAACREDFDDYDGYEEEEGFEDC